MNQVATLRDVAERVSKSVSAVSKALNGSPDISPATVAAVRKAAADLGYEPNAAALQLKRQRTDTVAVILPEGADLRVSDPFFAEFLTGLAEQLAAYGLDLLLSTVDESDHEDAYLKHMRARKVDGFVVVRTQLDDWRIPILDGRGIPFVSFGRSTDADTHPFIDEDGANAMAAVVEHLVALGHRRLVCVAEPAGYTKAHNRVQGFLAGLAAHDLERTAESVVVAGYRQKAGYEAAMTLLSQPNPPTAVACCNDLIALGAMRAAQNCGLLVGSDISITGFDDITLAAHTTPSLTTVRNAAHDSGRIAADILGRSIRGLHVERSQVLLDLDFVVRDSTGPPRSVGGRT